jgi:hypothetical protein
MPDGDGEIEDGGVEKNARSWILDKETGLSSKAVAYRVNGERAFSRGRGIIILW